MTDLFLNYDCNLQASNLYERTLKCLATILQSAPGGPQPASGTARKIPDLALECLLIMLKALDERASPLKVSPSTAASPKNSSWGSGPADSSVCVLTWLQQSSALTALAHKRPRHPWFHCQIGNIACLSPKTDSLSHVTSPLRLKRQVRRGTRKSCHLLLG